METQEILNKTEYMDSCSFGTPSTGTWKAYYNSSRPDEAKERIKASADLFEYGKTLDKAIREK